MGKWDENSGYYCLLITIFCQKILRKKIKTEYREDMDSDEVGEMMYQLRKAGYTLEEISNAFNCYPSTVRRRIEKVKGKDNEKQG